MKRVTGQVSLRRTLLVWLLLPLIALVPVAAGVVYSVALSPAIDALDRALTGTVVALVDIVRIDGGRASLPISEQTARALRADVVDEIRFAVGDGQGRLLGGQASLLALAPKVADGEWRFFEAAVDGRPMRIAARGLACGSGVCVVCVGETMNKRAAAERAALVGALVAAAALGLPLVVLALVSVQRAMRPLHRVALDVEAMRSDRVSSIDDHDVPLEARAFVQALNRLLARLRGASAAQRAFVADAAHQLRTPLAVLRVEAAQLLASPHPEPLTPALQRLHAAAERGSRLAQQLLALARVEEQALAPMYAQRVDLAHVCAAAADHWVPASLAAGQDLGFDLQPAWVEGNPVLLEELVGNLVHNTIEHAGRGASVTLRTATEDGAALLVVEDDGPGIAEQERTEVWQRFRRGRGAAGGGSGLGLAIVGDIARLHGARATLGAGSGGRGLRVEVRFVQPAAA